MLTNYVINEGKEGGTSPGRAAGIVIYSVLAYNLGVAGLGILILAMAGLIPLGGVVVFTNSPGLAVSINLLLLALFGVQHSVMARPAFKRRFRRSFAHALERSTFVWASGLAMALCVLFWQPLQGVVWQSEGILRIVLWAGFAFGWAYLLAATFAINHFDLFGLRQAWLEARGKTYAEVAFKEHWMYRYSRHPIMLGALLGVWCVPTMTASMLMLSLGLTLYIAIGLYFEERDLIRQWGQSYLNYKHRVRAFF